MSLRLSRQGSESQILSIGKMMSRSQYELTHMMGSLVRFAPFVSGILGTCARVVRALEAVAAQGRN